MAQVAGIRTTGQAISETTLVRWVSDKGLLLEPNIAPLITFLLNLKKKQPVTSPRIEWFEDDYVSRWAASADTTNANSSSTTVTVADGTMFVVGDLIAVPRAATSSTQPEIMRVTARSSDTLTVVRGVGSTSLVTINNGDALAILGTAHEEGSTPPVAKSTTKVAKISYTEIFKKTVNLSKTQVASTIYGAPSGERALQHMKLLNQVKIDMNRSFLFGVASEALTGGANSLPIRTTMGLSSRVSTNKYDAGGTLTRKGLESFARMAFRYGDKGTKLLLASPLVISAVHDWANAHQQIQPAEKVFGVNINRVITGHGEWMLVRDWGLEDGVSGKYGFSGWAFSIDINDDSMMYCPLVGHEENRDIKITENVIRDGRDAYVDEVLAEVGLAIKHEKRHAHLFDCSDYQGT